MNFPLEIELKSREDFISSAELFSRNLRAPYWAGPNEQKRELCLASLELKILIINFPIMIYNSFCISKQRLSQFNFL